MGGAWSRTVGACPARDPSSSKAGCAASPCPSLAHLRWRRPTAAPEGPPLPNWEEYSAVVLVGGGIGVRACPAVSACCLNIAGRRAQVQTGAGEGPPAHACVPHLRPPCVQATPLLAMLRHALDQRSADPSSVSWRVGARCSSAALKSSRLVVQSSSARCKPAELAAPDCGCSQAGGMPERVHFLWASREPLEFCIMDPGLLAAARCARAACARWERSGLACRCRPAAAAAARTGYPGRAGQGLTHAPACPRTARCRASDGWLTVELFNTSKRGSPPAVMAGEDSKVLSTVHLPAATAATAAAACSTGVRRPPHQCPCDLCTAG